jgi:hypothetical protein
MNKKAPSPASQSPSAANLASRHKLNRCQVLFDATLRDELRIVAADEGESLIDTMVSICRAHVDRWERKKGPFGTAILERIRNAPRRRRVSGQPTPRAAKKR